LWEAESVRNRTALCGPRVFHAALTASTQRDLSICAVNCRGYVSGRAPERYASTEHFSCLSAQVAEAGSKNEGRFEFEVAAA